MTLLLCSECDHKVGQHQAVANPAEYGMDRCNVSGCGCTVTLEELDCVSDHCCQIGASLWEDVREAVQKPAEERRLRRAYYDTHHAQCTGTGHRDACPNCGVSGAFGGFGSCVRCGHRKDTRQVVAG